jgi:hypothetical protein
MVSEVLFYGSIAWGLNEADYHGCGMVVEQNCSPHGGWEAERVKKGLGDKKHSSIACVIDLLHLSLISYIALPCSNANIL